MTACWRATTSPACGISSAIEFLIRGIIRCPAERSSVPARQRKPPSSIEKRKADEDEGQPYVFVYERAMFGLHRSASEDAPGALPNWRGETPSKRS